MNQAHRIPASQKAPGDFAPLPLPAVHKKFVYLAITRKGGGSESARFILRPGDVMTIDGKNVAEG